MMSIIRQALDKAQPSLLNLYRKLLLPPPPNLEGDRYIEYSWVAANLPHGPGQALDLGCGYSWMGLLAARHGFKVIAIDLRDITWPYIQNNLNFVKGNIFDLQAKLPNFDLIVCVSTLEHIGLASRYADLNKKSDSDFDAMSILYNSLKVGGQMLLTLPVGQDIDILPLHRVYGEKRLDKLLGRFNEIHDEYWIKEKKNQWIISDRAKALQQIPSASYYALGLFRLIK